MKHIANEHEYELVTVKDFDAWRSLFKGVYNGGWNSTGELKWEETGGKKFSVECALMVMDQGEVFFFNRGGITPSGKRFDEPTHVRVAASRMGWHFSGPGSRSWDPKTFTNLYAMRVEELLELVK